MIRIGLMSDTHSYLDDTIFQYFESCDEVWHAGDFGSLDVVQRLQKFKPLLGVWGNIDAPSIRHYFDEHFVFKKENVKIYMTHIGGYPGRYNPMAKKIIQAEQPKLFISGHSHILKVMPDKQHNLLHMNPGACGQEGWHKMRTIIRFTIDDDIIKEAEVVELGSRTVNFSKE
ncbi:MAG: metallophosphoesterase family protein [Saprospiraceae bacterium]